MFLEDVCRMTKVQENRNKLVYLRHLITQN